MNDRPLVMCADDDEDILALVSLRLERAGYDVAKVADGDAALDGVRELKPAVVVLDVMMPRRTGPEVPVGRHAPSRNGADALEDQFLTRLQSGRILAV